ncbi:hypothetical protein OH77DRAFT_343125 [Trametes cingulata]|nr:hypothetical protein OH77DRAFT_343125 [Trametes cingulata]
MTNSVYYIRSEPGPTGSTKTHRLVLTTTSLRNVVLANATDVLYYEVVTPRWERHLTRISRLDPNTRCFDLVAELLNGQSPGTAGAGAGAKDDDAKRVVALRFYGAGELHAVDEFLHVEPHGAMETKGRHLDELSAFGFCLVGG